MFVINVYDYNKIINKSMFKFEIFEYKSCYEESCVKSVAASFSYDCIGVIRLSCRTETVPQVASSK